MRYSQQCGVDYSRFFGFGGHSIFEFILLEGPLQTLLVANVIFPTIQMQPHNHGDSVTRMLWQSVLYPKCILWLSLAHFEHEVPSAMNVGFGCLAASPNVVGLCHSVQCSVLCLSLQIWVVFCVHRIQCWVISSWYPVVGSTKPPYNNLFAKGLAWGTPLHPADNISRKGHTGLHSNTIWYHREYVSCNIGEIGVLWLCFLLLSPPVCDMWYPNVLLISIGLER